MIKKTAHKILIADDDQNIVISLEFLMQREGFEVITAYDGEQALNLIGQEHPDLVLLDVMMPGKTGFEVCQTLRADPDFDATRILILTGRNRETDRAKGLAVGADAYMTKPFSPRDLVSSVRTLLGLPS